MRCEQIEKYAGAEEHFECSAWRKSSAHLRRLASTIHMYYYVLLQYFLDNANHIGFLFDVVIFHCNFLNSISLELYLLKFKVLSTQPP